MLKIVATEGTEDTEFFRAVQRSALASSVRNGNFQRTPSVLSVSSVAKRFS